MLVFNKFKRQKSIEKSQPKATTLWLTIISKKPVKDFKQNFDIVVKAKNEKKINLNQKKREKRKANANSESFPIESSNATGANLKVGQN